MKTYYIRTRNAWWTKCHVILADGISEAREKAALIAYCDGSRYADIYSTNGAWRCAIQEVATGRGYILAYTPDEMRETLTAEQRAAWGEVNA